MAGVGRIDRMWDMIVNKARQSGAVLKKLDDRNEFEWMPVAGGVKWRKEREAKTELHLSGGGAGQRQPRAQVA